MSARVGRRVRRPGAQNGVGEAIEMGGFRAQAREFNGVGDGGVRRDGEDRQFSGACQQNKANANGIRRQGLFEELADDAFEIGVAAQDGHGEEAGEGLVAGVKGGEIGCR